MKIIKPFYQIETDLQEDKVSEMLKRIESAGRICYQSSHKITENSYIDFLKNKINIGKVNSHESVIEHEYLQVRFVCDRGVSHELVRHRLAAFSQESTRYCNYSLGKFDGQLTFILPPWIGMKYLGEYDYNKVCQLEYETGSLRWIKHCLDCEIRYKILLESKWKPEQARSILPNSLKTEIVVTANLREWRHIFKMRCSKKAHPQMRELMVPLLNELQVRIPVIFDGIGE